MKKYLNLIVILISIATVVSGLLQLVKPGIVLGLIGSEITPTSSHFFSIVGMFMLLFGLLMLHVIYSAHSNRVAVFWCAMQKIGASAAVGIGVVNEVFGVLALGVALFDLLSGIILFWYFKIAKADEID
ncbi:patatin [Mangrovibacterium lignilyticum]|uniref:patatin n=1 Tax=Mangrovibacterium lignilyticum TaxID=2668052 RepID=UPI0013CF4A7D|nr:patatin [Mangrovibacterium lignilyticum]